MATAPEETVSQIEAVMALWGCSEEEARWILAVDAGEIPGDVIERDEPAENEHEHAIHP